MYFCVEFAEKIFPHLFFHCSIPSLNNTRLLLVISLRVAGVRKGRGRELGRETTREGGGRREEGNLSFLSFLSPSRAPHALARAQIPPSPSRFNAGHVGYLVIGRVKLNYSCQPIAYQVACEQALCLGKRVKKSRGERKDPFPSLSS